MAMRSRHQIIATSFRSWQAVIWNPLGFSPREVVEAINMPYVRIWVHLIWATKERMPILTETLRGEIFAHIKDNASKKNIYLDVINGTADHVHSLVSLKSDQTIAKVAQLLKGESSHWVNDKSLSNGKFEWQDEYIAVSVNETMIDTVRRYVKNQAEHHRKKTFPEEYQEFIEEYGFAITANQ